MAVVFGLRYTPLLSLRYSILSFPGGWSSISGESRSIIVVYPVACAARAA